jgi:hypothetical protein
MPGAEFTAITEDAPHHRLEFCEWIQRNVCEDAQFLGITFWTDEAIFKLNGTANQHKCVYWSSKNPNVLIDKAVNLSGPSVCCGVSSKGAVGPFCFEGTVTGAACLSKLKYPLFPPFVSCMEMRTGTPTLPS